MKPALMELVVCWRIPRLRLADEERCNGWMAASGRIGDEQRRACDIDDCFAFENRAGEPRIAGTDAAGLSRPSLVLCGGQKTWRPSSDGTALRRAGARLWPAGGTRRPTPARQRTDDHAGSQGLARVCGVRQSQGPRLSA